MNEFIDIIIIYFVFRVIIADYMFVWQISQCFYRIIIFVP